MASHLGQRVLDAIDDGVRQRWEPATTRAAAVSDTGTIADQVRAVTVGFRHELGVAGALAGGAAAVPGVGLAATSTAFAVELAWSTVRLTDLILTIAAIHGHHDASVEERRLWVLSLLTYGDRAARMVDRLADDTIEREAARRPSAPRVTPAEVARQLNRSLAATVASRYGSKRGAMALGRAVPFGIGAVLGFGMNSYVVKTTARHAHRFFSDLPVVVRATQIGPAG